MSTFKISEIDPAKWGGRTVIEIPNAVQGEYLDIQIAEAGWIFNRSPPDEVSFRAGIFVEGGFDAQTDSKNNKNEEKNEKGTHLITKQVLGREGDEKYENIHPTNLVLTKTVISNELKVSMGSHYYLKTSLETQDKSKKDLRVVLYHSPDVTLEVKKCQGVKFGCGLYPDKTPAAVYEDYEMTMQDLCDLKLCNGWNIDPQNVEIPDEKIRFYKAIQKMKKGDLEFRASEIDDKNIQDGDNFTIKTKAGKLLGKGKATDTIKVKLEVKYYNELGP